MTLAPLMAAQCELVHEPLAFKCSEAAGWLAGVEKAQG